MNDHPYAEIEARDWCELTRRFPGLTEKRVNCKMDGPAPSFFDELVEALERKDRRGEVILTVRHRDGRLWLHRKAHYPDEAYRLLSGGIKKTESALDAARRECWEEVGLEIEPATCLGIIRYQIARNGLSVNFISYVFLLEGSDHTPAPRDSGEQIVGFRLVEPAQLGQVADMLRRVPAGWRDWGYFRAIGHEFVAEQLATQCRTLGP